MAIKRVPKRRRSAAEMALGRAAMREGITFPRTHAVASSCLLINPPTEAVAEVKLGPDGRITVLPNGDVVIPQGAIIEVKFK